MMDIDELVEVDIHTLQATRLSDRALPGQHGKGAFTGQGVLAVANNGFGGFAEWNGSSWSVISEDQHVSVAGPTGISGDAPDPAAPMWSQGWDHRSAILRTRMADTDTWALHRLPIASHHLHPSQRVLYRMAPHPGNR